MKSIKVTKTKNGSKLLGVFDLADLLNAVAPRTKGKQDKQNLLHSGHAFTVGIYDDFDLDKKDIVPKSVECFVLDFDLIRSDNNLGALIEDIRRSTACAFWWYHTSSSTKNRNRIRVIFPLSRSIDPHHVRPLVFGFVQNINNVSHDPTNHDDETSIVDMSCASASRIHFLPVDNGDVSGSVFFVDGDCVDPDLYDLEQTQEPKSCTSTSNVTQIVDPDLIERIQKYCKSFCDGLRDGDGRNQSLFSAAMSIAWGFGIDDDSFEFDILVDDANKMFADQLLDDEVDQIKKSVIKIINNKNKPKNNPRGYLLQDAEFNFDETKKEETKEETTAKKGTVELSDKIGQLSPHASDWVNYLKDKCSGLTNDQMFTASMLAVGSVVMGRQFCTAYKGNTLKSDLSIIATSPKATGKTQVVRATEKLIKSIAEISGVPETDGSVGHFWLYDRWQTNQMSSIREIVEATNKKQVMLVYSEDGVELATRLYNAERSRERSVSDEVLKLNTVSTNSFSVNISLTEKSLLKLKSSSMTCISPSVTFAIFGQQDLCSRIFRTEASGRGVFDRILFFDHNESPAVPGDVGNRKLYAPEVQRYFDPIVQAHLEHFSEDVDRVPKYVDCELNSSEIRAIMRSLVIVGEHEHDNHYTARLDEHCVRVALALLPWTSQDHKNYRVTRDLINLSAEIVASVVTNYRRRSVFFSSDDDVILRILKVLIFAKEPLSLDAVMSAAGVLSSRVKKQAVKATLAQIKQIKCSGDHYKIDQI